MPDTDLYLPGRGPLRAAAEAAELLAQAVSGLVTADGYRLVGSDPLADAIARSLTEAGLPLHRCARQDPWYWLGGICLLPVPAGPADRRAGIGVSWTAHSLLRLDWDRPSTYAGTRQAMNTAFGVILRAFAYPAGRFGPGRAWLVTGHRGQGPGAGR